MKMNEKLRSKDIVSKFEYSTIGETDDIKTNSNFSLCVSVFIIYENLCRNFLLYLRQR